MGYAPFTTSRPRESRAVVVLALLLCGCASGAPGGADVSGQTAPRTSARGARSLLTGTWQFNVEASTPLRSGGGAAAGAGAGGGRRGRRGGTPPAEAPAVPADGGAQAGGPRGAPQRLVITQTDSSVAFASPRTRPYTLFFDGRDVWVGGAGEPEVAVRARRRGNAIEVRRTGGDGRTVTETYQLSRNGERLTITVRTPGSGTEMAPPVTRRVYDRVVAR